jgi:TonB family protein
MSADKSPAPKGAVAASSTAPVAPIAQVNRPTFGGGLLASKPPRTKGTVAMSVVSFTLHGIIVAAVVATTIGKGVTTDEDEVTVVELTQEFQPPPPPPPPPVDQPQAQFQGFQTLTVPDIVPAEIPPPGEVAFKASDFTGQGVEGGIAAGEKKEEAVVAIGETPSFTPFTVAPNLKNRDDVGRALEREYPPLLRDAGVGGKVEVWVRISDKGAVEDVQIHQSSGHPALDEAAIKVGQVMQFTPAMNRDKQVPVWVSIPITFQVR